MTTTRLSPDRAAQLAEEQLTYAQVGETRNVLPRRYHQVSREGPLGVGEDRFAEAVQALFPGSSSDGPACACWPRPTR